MKILRVFTRSSLIVFLAAGIAQGADLKAELQSAAKALSEKENYSWITKTDMGANARFAAGPTTGKTAKGGLALIEQEMNDSTLQIARKGEKAAVKTPDGWKLESELPQAGGGGGQDPAARAAMMGRRMLTIKAPADEVLATISKLGELKSVEGVISADLTEEGAKELLARGGRRPGGNAPEIKNAKGTAKYWIKDGLLNKTEIKVSGTMTGRDGEARETQRTTTTEIKDVNATKITLPEDASKKLS